MGGGGGGGYTIQCLHVWHGNNSNSSVLVVSVIKKYTKLVLDWLFNYYFSCFFSTC